MESMKNEATRLDLLKRRFNWNKGLVIFSLNYMSFSCGFMQGATGGLVSALQRRDEGIVLTDGQISLIAAFLTFCLIFGVLYAAVLGGKVSRKCCYILSSIPEVLNWILLYYAKGFAMFMISRLLAGVSLGALSVLNTAITAEFTTQNTRALHITLVTNLSTSAGAAMGHVIGVLLHWRHVALLGILLSTLQLMLPPFWVESPHWLAMKGRFEECQNAFRKLHGNAIATENELTLLIKMERNKQQMVLQTNSSHGFRKLFAAMKRRYFWDLMLLATFLYSYYAAAGRMVFMSLATVMLQEMTGTSDILLYTLLTDGFLIMGTLVSCILIKKLTIRTLLFSSGLTAVGFLLVLSSCLFFGNGEGYFQWINVILLAVYFIIINAGPYPVMEIIMGEMYPLDLKLYYFFLTSPITISTVFLSILSMPFLISAIGYHGLFLVNSGVMLVCLAYLYARLPETKGKTLQEIEVYFKTKNYDIDAVLTNNEQIKALI